MNNKHIASLVLFFLCVLIVEGVSLVHKQATKAKEAAQKALQESKIAQNTLTTQRAVLDDMKKKSADLLAYLDAWEPYLTQTSTPEAGELSVNVLLKQANLLVLAQRFDVSPNKSDSSVPNAANIVIPQLVRANLTIEDDFVKTINWLGNVEKTLPAARVSSLNLIRGQSGNDLRMIVVVDVPMAKPPVETSSTP